MRRGLYSNFVTSSENKPYRGAEIAPPESLRGNSGNSGRGGSSSSNPKGVNKQGYSTISSISANANMYDTNAGHDFNPRRVMSEDDYFNEDDDNDYRIGSSKKASTSNDDCPYQPAPGSPGGPSDSKKAKKEDSDSEEDALDAFMANLEKEAQTQGVKAVDKKQSQESSSSKFKKGGNSSKSIKGTRQDIDEADDEESYYKWLEENPNAGRMGDEEDDIPIDYDEDGNPIVPVKSKHIDPLASIDHSQISYKPFEKSFYQEHADIIGLSRIQVIDLQQKLGIRVSGASPPKPVSSFGHFGFDEPLMKAIRKSDFSQPTPIQSQAIPAL